MADPIKWHGCNQTVEPPKGLEDVIRTIPRWTNNRVGVTCWQLSQDEMAEVIQNGGKIFVAIMTGQQYSMYVGLEEDVRKHLIDYGTVWKKETENGDQSSR
jgi:hypothetical protein